MSSSLSDTSESNSLIFSTASESGGVRLPRHPRLKASNRTSSGVPGKALSGVLVKRRCTGWTILFLEQGLYSAYRFRSQQHVAAYGTNVGGNVIDDDHLTTVPYGVHDAPGFMFSRTSINAAFHVDCLRCVGVIYLGNLDS